MKYIIHRHEQHQATCPEKGFVKNFGYKIRVYKMYYHMQTIQYFLLYNSISSIIDKEKLNDSLRIYGTTHNIFNY